MNAVIILIMSVLLMSASAHDQRDGLRGFLQDAINADHAMKEPVVKRCLGYAEMCNSGSECCSRNCLVRCDM